MAMSEDRDNQKIRETYSAIFRQCVSLNTELYKLAPLAKQIHLLSSNAVSSAARAGSEGDAFRVLAQDIQLLGEDVSHCVNDTQQVTSEIVMLSSKFSKLFEHFTIYNKLVNHTNFENQDIDVKTSLKLSEKPQKKIAEEIITNNHKLTRYLGQLSNLMSPLVMLVKKGEYLAVFSSVEAASVGEHGTSFEAISAMLRELVGQLGIQSGRQRLILRDLTELMEKQQNILRNMLYTH